MMEKAEEFEFKDAGPLAFPCFLEETATRPMMYDKGFEIVSAFAQ
ncbi:MAG TPA: hypothetical protein VFA71_03435 [Terriglobales bacterium]|nr:hypothetical protein [Terriglobales bacterium]